jgi:hypothetical protein
MLWTAVEIGVMTADFGSDTCTSKWKALEKIADDLDNSSHQVINFILGICQ